MEIKVGECIRFKNGEIRQITGKDIDGHLLVDIYIHGSKWLTFNEEADIVKHSSNIIDLIEVEDIIEYVEQTEGKEGTVLGKIYAQRIVDARELDEVKKDIKNNGIKLLSVLTHQQFEANAYKIEQT